MSVASVGLGCCRGSSLLYCSGVPLVVCHVNSSERGTVSTLSEAPLPCPQFVPSPVLHLSAPRGSDPRWICLSGEPTAYSGSKVPAGKRGSHLFVSLTPRSQWLCLTMDHSPLLLISLPKAGKSKYLSAPTTMASAEEKRNDQSISKAVGQAAAEILTKSL